MFTSFLHFLDENYNDSGDYGLMNPFRTTTAAAVTTSNSSSVVPPTDIYAEGPSLFFKVLLYGDLYKADDLEVTYNNQILTIKTKEEFVPTKWPNRKYYRTSIFNGAFKVSWQTKLALDFVSAKFKDSVLEIELRNSDRSSASPKNLLSAE